jgi:hypothetical protein
MRKFELKKADYGILPEWIRERIRLGLYVQEAETGDIWNISQDGRIAWELIVWKQAQSAQGETYVKNDR